MPYRKVPIVSEEIYHIFNRSIAGQPLFLVPTDYRRAFELINFYRYADQPVRFSHFKQLSVDLKQRFLEEMKNRLSGIEILAYCLMPNHVHFLVKQLQEKAISDFMRKVLHGYSSYFNLKHKRTGSLFQAMFKLVRIETDEQLAHVSRYIHLNPVTACIIQIEMLERYAWSSFSNYVANDSCDSFVATDQVLSNFRSRDAYKTFVFDQADYQRELAKIKRLLLE